MLNGKFYVGRHSTNNFEDGYFGSGKILKRAIKKYGKKNFKKEIIEQCSDFEILCDREEYWIEELKAIEKGYNIIKTSKGTGCGEANPFYGKKHSEKSLKKMSEIHKGKIISLEQRLNLSKTNKGRKHTEEAKNKIGKAHKGKKLSKEQIDGIKKYAKTLIGDKNPMFGKKHSEKSKRKMSNSHKGVIPINKGVPMKEEQKMKLSKLMKGRKITEGHKIKIGLGNKGKLISLETRKKLSEANKGIPQKKVTCPYCDKVGGISPMKRYHFDNCKYKEILING